MMIRLFLCFLFPVFVLAEEPPVPVPAPEVVQPVPNRDAALVQEHAKRLAASRATWKTLKAKCGGNYHYTKSFSSFTGFGNETTVVVRKNKVVERRFREFGGRPQLLAPGKPPPAPAGPKWVERGKEIGTHKQGAAPRTLDELYDEADKILKQPIGPTHRRGLRFDKQGLLTACYTVDTLIADDAPITGVSIGRITLDTP